MLVIAFLGMLNTTLPVKAEPKGNPANWVMASDIPKSEWPQARTTSLDLTLDDTGRPVACNITRPSGSAVIDVIVCRSLMKRARYKPAKDANGAALPSVIRDHVQWQPEAYGSNQYSRDLPDIIVTNSAATSKISFDVTKVVEIIGPSGTIENCGVYSTSNNHNLDNMACAIASRPDISLIVKDKANAPIRGVRDFNVGYLAADGDQVYVR